MVSLAGEWEQGELLCQEVYRSGFAKVQETNAAELQKAAYSGEAVICCVDERVDGPLHVAGSLILLGQTEAEQIVEKHQIQGITSHAGCGAMGLYFEQQNGRLAEAAELDAFARQETEALAVRLGVQYGGHITHLHGPSEAHIARAIYYHSTPYFNANQVSNLPAGFSVSRSILTKETALADVRLCISIAFGQHGFGEQFTAEHPLLIVAVSPLEGLEVVRTELLPLQEEYGERIQIEGLAV